MPGTARARASSDVRLDAYDHPHCVHVHLDPSGVVHRVSARFICG